MEIEWRGQTKKPGTSEEATWTVQVGGDGARMRVGTVEVREGLGFWIFLKIEIWLMYNLVCFESRTDWKHRPWVESGVVCVPQASHPTVHLPQHLDS